MTSLRLIPLNNSWISAWEKVQDKGEWRFSGPCLVSSKDEKVEIKGKKEKAQARVGQTVYVDY